MQEEILQRDTGGEDFLFEYGIKYMELLLLIKEELDQWKRMISGRYAVFYNLYYGCLKMLSQKILSEMHLEQVVPARGQRNGKECSLAFNDFSTNQRVSQEALIESYKDLSRFLKYTYGDVDMLAGKAGAVHWCEAYCKNDGEELMVTLCPFCTTVQNDEFNKHYLLFNQISLRRGMTDFSGNKTGYANGENIFVQISLTEKEWQMIKDEFFLQGQYLEDYFEKFKQICPRKGASVSRCCQLLKQMWLHKKVLSLYSPC